MECSSAAWRSAVSFTGCMDDVCLRVAGMLWHHIDIETAARQLTRQRLCAALAWVLSPTTM
eukprot:362401-Chlamydomonas_euryale.AAC.4